MAELAQLKEEASKKMVAADNAKLVAENAKMVAENAKLVAENEKMAADNMNMAVENKTLRTQNEELTRENRQMMQKAAEKLAHKVCSNTCIIQIGILNYFRLILIRENLLSITKKILILKKYRKYSKSYQSRFLVKSKTESKKKHLKLSIRAKHNLSINVICYIISVITHFSATRHCKNDSCLQLMLMSHPRTQAVQASM
jgi:hypothetical protein